MTGSDLILAKLVAAETLPWMPTECWGTHDQSLLRVPGLVECINVYRQRPLGDWNRCESCGDRVIVLTVDHWVPRSRGGCNHLHNLRLLCVGCNADKADLLPWEFNHDLAAWVKRKGAAEQARARRAINAAADQLMNATKKYSDFNTESPQPFEGVLELVATRVRARATENPEQWLSKRRLTQIHRERNAARASQWRTQLESA